MSLRAWAVALCGAAVASGDAAKSATKPAKPKRGFHLPHFHIPFTGGDKGDPTAPDTLPTPTPGL